MPGQHLPALRREIVHESLVFCYAVMLLKEFVLLARCKYSFLPVSYFIDSQAIFNVDILRTMTLTGENVAAN